MMKPRAFHEAIEVNLIVSITNNSSFLFLTVALKLFTTVCVSVVSCARSFSNSKLIKNHFRSTMNYTNLNNLAMLALKYKAKHKILIFEYVIMELAVSWLEEF